MKKNSLALCMIVKNEEKFIKKTIDSVIDIVDEIIIVDTGSTDKTLEILSSYNNINLYNHIWENDFSKSRNFALSKIKSDWILFIDADEILDVNSKKNIIEFINNTNLDGCHFLIYNYISEGSNNFSIHHGLRLFKNNKGFYYKGKIHEQISNDSIVNLKERFSKENIILHHYGYTSEVLEKKNKRNRNIPILLDTLKENPTDSFTLFNMGNEYLANNDILMAIKYYEEAFKYIDLTNIYSIHLFYRISICYQNIKKYDKALSYVNKALDIYSPNVDLEYLRGTIYLDSNRYTLAIDSFNECLSLGDNVSDIKFINNCGSINPLISLGNLYFKLEDYKKSLLYYEKALNLDNNNNINLLYNISEILNKLIINKKDIPEYLFKYFSDKNYLPNIIFICNILIKENLIDESLNLISKFDKSEINLIDINYIYASISFYKKDFDKSLEYFNKLFIYKDISNNNNNIIINNLFEESSKLLFIIYLIKNPKKLTIPLNIIKKYCSSSSYNLYENLYNIYLNKSPFEINDNTKEILIESESFFNKLILIKEFDLFQELIEILNYINDESVLITLAKVYKSNNLIDLAYETTLESIKRFNYIDISGLEILNLKIK